jgi:exonuclease SbcC
LEQAQSTLADAENVLERYATLQELRARERHLAGLQEQAAAIESRIEAHGREVAAEEARLQARADALKEDVTRLTVLAAALPALHAQALEFESMRAGIAALDASVEASRSRTAELKSTQAGAEAEARQCKEANKELHQKQEQLRAAEGEASCPICRQPLSPGDIEHVMAEYAAQRKQLGERFSQAEQAARTAAEESARLDGEVSTMQRQGQHQREDLQRRERDHHALLKAAEEATEALPRREAELAALLVTIPDGAFAAEPRQRLQAAHAELAAVGYDAGAHRAVRDQVIALDGVDDEMRAVTSAGERAAALGEQQGQLDASLAARRLEMAEAEAAAEASEAALALTEDAGPRLGQQEAELASLQSQERDLAVQQGRMEQQRHHLRETMARVETARELLQAHREEEQTYGDLAKAFGRDGVQAMLIDQSLPRIEQVANGMLDHMTGGRIHVALATQRLTAKGTVQETLDIRISDEMGTRDYEMYSGGEAFRVDFALRIALARLLAERAGAELPTLIIDEGFGSQDQEGIDRLVEAIQAVRDEFRLILVVTHVEELRERFERRIEVTKDPERGSFARVV